MASYSALATVSTGDPWTASDHNTYIKDNFTYVKDELDDHSHRMRSRIGGAKTISSGSITVLSVDGYATHQVEGESGADDDLATISGGSNGDILVLKKGGEEITLVSSGNIDVGNHGDLVLSGDDDHVVLLYDGAVWHLLATNVMTSLTQVGYSAPYANGDSGASVTIDWTKGNIQTLRLTGNAQISHTDPLSAGRYTLLLLGDGTARSPDIDYDSDCTIVDDGEPSSFGSTNNEIVGILTYVFEPGQTPKYLVAGASVGG